MTADIDSMLEAGELWVYANSQAAVAGGASVKIGILTGNVPVRVLSRGYESTGEIMTIYLYKVAFTGGSALSQVYNRNRSYQAGAQPVSALAGVTFTPNTPEIAAVVRALTTANNAVLVRGEEDALELLAGTSYVLELVNSDIGPQTISTSITMRRKQPSERLR